MSPCRSGPSDTAHASRGVEEAMGHRVARPAMGSAFNAVRDRFYRRVVSFNGGNK